MLLQISNQVTAVEVTSGDYVDADDELSLKDTVSSMLNAQKESAGSFDDKMWGSVFWDPLNERPDKVTSELNKYFKINQTDNRVYANQSGSSSTSGSASVSILQGMFGGGASGSHTSTTSMTTDQFRHLLEVYDIESDIEGEKFIPKKLDLYRLNVNDLTRTDSVVSKRVRVRQVDIGGVLQVAIGNSTLGDLETENRYLRKQLDDLTAQQADIKKQLADMRKVDEATRNDLNGQIDKLANLTDRLLHSASPDPSGTCERYSTSRVRCDRQNSVYCLYFHDIRCPSGRFLTQFHFVDEGLAISHDDDLYSHYEFTCCSVI